MQPSLATMLYLILNFVLLVGVLWYLLYKPVGKLLRDRQSGIAAELDEAERKLKEAEALKDEYEHQVTDLKRQRRDAIERASWQGEQERRRIIAEARQEAAEIVQRAAKQAEVEKIRAWEDMKDQVIEATIEIASVILKREVIPADQEKLVDRFTSQIAAGGKSAD